MPDCDQLTDAIERAFQNMHYHKIKP